MDASKFAELAIVRFPELRDDILEWSGLIHLQMMELELLVERSATRGEWETVERCMDLLHTALCEGDAELTNAVHVSFLEDLPREGLTSQEILRRMTPELRQAQTNILRYLHSLSISDEP